MNVGLRSERVVAQDKVVPAHPVSAHQVVPVGGQQNGTHRWSRRESHDSVEVHRNVRRRHVLGIVFRMKVRGSLSVDQDCPGCGNVDYARGGVHDGVVRGQGERNSSSEAGSSSQLQSFIVEREEIQVLVSCNHGACHHGFVLDLHFHLQAVRDDVFSLGELVQEGPAVSDSNLFVDNGERVTEADDQNI